MLDFQVVLWSIIGYLTGSISWSIIIGKLVFHKDIREYGSGNPGGTNAGRVFGIKTGIEVILLDAFKALVVMIICSLFYEKAIAAAGFAAVIGHCFPVYYHFKGGKAVSTGYGFILGLCIFYKVDYIFTLVYPLLIFVIVLCLCKMMSLASMTSLLSAAIITHYTCDNQMIRVLVTLLALLVIIRHRSNIKRIYEGKESKVKFIK